MIRRVVDHQKIQRASTSSNHVCHSTVPFPLYVDPVHLPQYEDTIGHTRWHKLKYNVVVAEVLKTYSKLFCVIVTVCGSNRLMQQPSSEVASTIH